MSIQLLSISHKTAPTQVRGMFALDDEKKMQILRTLISQEEICEAVILSTCSRTELYCSGEKDNKIFSKMQQFLLEAAGAEKIPGMTDSFMRFQGRRAVRHLFRVTAGLDSVVIGEDQILGQVKQAYYFSKENGFTKSTFNSLFRLAITAAKKVKTDTVISKTSVSTAGLALKKALECHETLDNKNIMIIGASGKIGSIVLKDALDIAGLNIFVTVRSKLPYELHNQAYEYQVIPYEERYQWLDQMDIVISATTSPHYTITGEHFKNCVKTEKKRVFFDLAVPMDIDCKIGLEADTFYYSMEDMQELAQKNNEAKLDDIPKAEAILQKYEEQFLKDDLFGSSLDMMKALEERAEKELQKKPAGEIVKQFFYKVKENSNADEFAQFMKIVKKISD